MPIEVREKFDSRRLTKGQNPSAELAYVVLGTDNDIDARDALEDEAPTTYDGLPRQSVSIEPLGPLLWDGVARYGQASGGTIIPGEDAVYSFETSGGSQHITQSKDTVSSHAASGMTAPDFQGAIGVTADGVEGVDIAVPVFQFSETHAFPDESVTTAYKVTLFSLTGKTNAGGFRGFATGEVLFLGASGSRRTGTPEDDWEITFRFAVSPNATSLTVGPISGIAKKGWEYLWVRYADQQDLGSQAIVKRPVAAYVERVYDAGNFGALGI